MRSKFAALPLLSAFLLTGCFLGGPAQAANPIAIDVVQRTDAVSFETEILPILQKNCLACHSASEQQGGLVLESPAAMLSGGDNGAAVVAGRGAESLIITLASHQADPAMPPEGNDVAANNLTSAELGLLKLWIDQGARGSDGINSLSPRQWQPLPPGVHPVQAIALSEDGQYVACSRANQIFLYHVPSGQLITKLADPALDTPDTTGIAHQDMVQSLAFNDDADLLASGGFRQVKLWRRPRDVQRQNLASPGAATAVAVSSDRQWIAVAGADHSIRLFQAADGVAGPTLSGHVDAITSLRFTADNTRLVSGSLDQSIRIWQVADGSPQGLIESPTAVSAIELVDRAPRSVDATVDYAPAGDAPPVARMLVSGDTEKTIRVWELPESMPHKAASSLAYTTRAAVSRDGTLMAMLDSNQNHTVRVVSLAASADPAPATEVTTWAVERGVTAMAFVPLAAAAPDAPQQALLTGASDGSLRMWSLPAHTLLREWPGEPKPVTSLAVSADGGLAASGHDGGAIALWDLKAPEPEAVEAQVGDSATSASAALRMLEGNTQAITAMRFPSQGQTLFVAAADGTLRGYNTQTGQQLFATNHGAAIHDLAISPNEQVLATAGENAIVRLWQTNGGGFGPQQLTGFPGPVKSVTFSPDSAKVIAGTAGENPQTRVYELSTANVLQQFSGQQGAIVKCVAVAVAKPEATPQANAPVGLPLITVSTSGLYRWTATPVRQISGHTQAITSLAADPERVRHIYSGSRDGTIRRWNLDNGQAVQQFNHGGPVTAICVCGDGTRLASASENHTAKLFRSNGQQIAEMRGDVRLRVNQQRAQQQLSSANARLAVAKRLFDEAQQDLPKKVAAAKSFADMLAAANTEVNTKQAAVNAALAEKIAAEKAAIEASTAAKTALSSKQQAEQLASSAAAEMQATQVKLTQLQAASANDSQDPQLQQLVATAQQELTTLQQKSQQLAAAVQEPTQQAQNMATAANTAAQKVITVQKPYNDATAALEVALASQNLLSQQHALADQESKDAQALVPIRQQALSRAEAAKTAAEQQSLAASEALKQSEQPLRAIAFSPDGTLLATAGDFLSFHTWDGETGEAIAAFAGHTSPLRQVAFVDADTLVSASDDQSCRVWDLNPEWMLETTIGSKEDSNIITHRATAVDFNPQSDRLLVASGVPSRSGELQVFNLDDGNRVLYLPQAHDDVIYSARFSPDGKRIASGGADKYLRTFDLATSTQLRRYEGHTNYILGVAWKSDGEVIATSAADNTIKVWEAETGDQRRTIDQQLSKHVTAIQFLGDTSNVISSSGDKRVRMHNSDNGGVARNFPDVQAWLHCVAATADSRIVAAGDASGTVTIWNGTNGQVLHTLTAP